MDLLDMMETERSRVDAAFDIAKAVRGGAGLGGGGDSGPYFSQGSTALSLAGSYGMSTQAIEQYKHNAGWPYSSMKVICQRIARQSLRIAKRRTKPLARKGELTRNKQLLPGWFKSHASSVQIIDNHPMIDAINRPNPIMIRWSLMYVTVASLLITGKSFWWVYRTKDGEVQIWPLPTHWLQPKLGPSGKLYETWIVRPFGSAQSIEVPGSEISYFHMPDPSNPLGAISPLQAQAKSIVAYEFMTESQIRTFLNGHYPGLAITIGAPPDMNSYAGVEPKVVLTERQRADIIAAFKSRYRGVYKTEEPIILDDFIKDVKRMTNTPREMDFARSKTGTKEEITQGFGVNPISMGQVEHASRNSSATADDHLCSNTVNPIIELLSEYLTVFVLPMFGDDPGTSAFLEEARAFDEELNLQKYKDAILHGACSINEYRDEILGMGPVVGGDVTLIPNTVIVVPLVAIGDDGLPPPGASVNPFGEALAAQKPVPAGTNAGGVQAELAGDAVVGDSGSELDLTIGDQKDLGKMILARGKHYHCLAKHVTKETLKKVWTAQHAAAAKAFGKEVAAFLAKKARETAAGVRKAIAEHGLTSGKELASHGMESSRSFAADFRKSMRGPFVSLLTAGAEHEWELFKPRSIRQLAEIITKAKPNDHADSLVLPSGVKDAIAQFADDILGQGYWDDLPDDVRQKVADLIDAGISDGKSGEDIANEMADLLGDDAATRAELITRTESTGALNAGSQATRDVLAEQGLVNGKEWLAIVDQSTRETHVEANGQKVGPDEDFDIGGEAGAYPGDLKLSAGERCNCLLPGSMIDGSYEAAMRSSYRGQAVEVVLRSGRRLSMTPNHPVLSASGWVFAGELDCGQEVIAYHSQANRLRVASSDKKNDVPAKVEQVFEAFILRSVFCAGTPIEVRRADVDDFYGDGEFLDGEIEVVRADRKLSGDRISSGAKQARNFRLQSVDVQLFAELGQRAGGFRLGGIRAASATFPGSGQLTLNCRSVHRLPLRSFRFGSTANLDTGREELSFQTMACDAGFVGELLHRNASTVFLDEVVNVRKFDFVGHVYCLQNEGGLILSNGLVTSNCRCTAVSTFPDDGGGSGAAAFIDLCVRGLVP